LRAIHHRHFLRKSMNKQEKSRDNRGINMGGQEKQNFWENSAVLSSNTPLQSLSLDFSESSLLNVPDLVCLSHLRWDFVYQRPQHLLTRCAQKQRVFFIEEPIYTAELDEHLDISQRDSGVWVVVPHLQEGKSEEEVFATKQLMLDQLFEYAQISKYILWYYTPMAIPFSSHLKPLVVVYDCMDELSAFKGADPILKKREAELFNFADLVFTGGQSLYEAKRNQHPNVYAFPSSIDTAHFAQCRLKDHNSIEPIDQANIPYPRLGFFGVIDERMDIDLLGEIAQARPDWHLVIIGPVVKINPETLPKHPNIYYLGGKSYQELPSYIQGWDVALLPFARNESTRFISPTKTPEYLAAGKPVVSTSIRDVVRPYGENGLVQIADKATDFISAAEVAMQNSQASEWLLQVDNFLAQNSWDSTWEQMMHLIEGVISNRSSEKPDSTKNYSRSTPAA